MISPVLMAGYGPLMGFLHIGLTFKVPVGFSCVHAISGVPSVPLTSGNVPVTSGSDGLLSLECHLLFLVHIWQIGCCRSFNRVFVGLSMLGRSVLFLGSWVWLVPDWFVLLFPVVRV